MSENQPTQLIDKLLEPERYPHPVETVALHETHANWVLLAGEYAYKIKKPVNFGFLDFSSPEQRRFYCEEEIRLNRRLAPELYHRVVPITGSPTDPRPDGDGTAFEHAVLMTRFDPQECLDERLARGEVTRGELDRLAVDIARFHAEIPAASPSEEYGDLDALHRQVTENFTDSRERIDPEHRELLAEVEDMSHAAFEQLRERLERRRENGRVRECHGDLHLGNLVHYEGRVRAFDCIEFNPELRWVDTASETAFLLMDLAFRGRPDLAARWRNRYLEWSGDYDSVPTLGFFKAYRAMVRAKVALLAAEQKSVNDPAHTHQQTLAGNYLRTAWRALQADTGQILITHGLSGCGKSHIALGLTETLPALRLRSDVERKRLFGLDPLTESRSDLGGGIYTEEATRQTYERLATLATELARSGETVIVDATFLARGPRRRLREAAGDAGVPFTILNLQAPRPVLEERIRQRQAAGGDASEAGLAVLEEQLNKREPLAEEERLHCLDVDTRSEPDYLALAGRIRSHGRVYPT